MWVEVPETMLPRFDVPKSGIVEIPFAKGTAWRVRVVGDTEGTWWTDMSGAKPLIPSNASRRRVRIMTPDGKPAEAGVTIMAARSIGGERTVMAQLRSDGGGWFVLDAVPDQSVTIIISDDTNAPVTITAPISEIPSIITMAPGVTVKGKFVSREKRPVPDVKVEAEGWLGDSAIIHRVAASDAAGNWSLAQLPRDAHVIVAAHCAGYAPMRKELALSERLDLGTLTLTKGETLSIRIIDDAGHKAIADATIDAHLDRKATTNANGVATLRDVSTDEPLNLTVTASGFLTREIALAPPFAKEASVALTRAFSVKGRFVDAANQPIASTSVRVTNGKAFRDVHLSDASFSLTLDPDQRAELEFLSPSTRPLRVAVEGKRGEERDLGVLQPPEGIAIRGRLVDEAGAAIPNGAVWAPRQSAGGAIVAWRTGAVVRAESDADGTFVLRGVGSEPLLLRVDAAGFARSFVSVMPERDVAEADLGNITLRSGTTVRVTSKPGSSGVARIALRSEAGDVDTLTSAIQDGVASVAHVPAGRVVVSLVRDRSTTCEKEVDVPAQSEPFTVDCASGLVHVHGRVLVGQHAAPGGVLVWYSPHQTETEGLIMNQASNLGAQQQQVYGAPSEVTLRVAASGDFDSDELRSGAWSVRWISPDSGSTAPRDVTIPAEEQPAVVIQYPDAVARGQVVDQDAHPVRNANVREVGGSAFAMTAEGGEFSISGLLPGPHRFQAQSGKLTSETVEVRIEPDREPAPLRLVVQQQPSNDVAIHVLTAAGQPAANAFVFVDALDGTTRIVTTDLSGSATVSFTDPPERVRCATLYDGQWGFDRWRERNECRTGVTLQLGETGSLRISTEKLGGALNVEGPNGWNVSMLLRRIGTGMMLSADRSMNLTGLPPGLYNLHLGPGNDQADVRPRETTLVTFKN
ncbi:MAG: carboxypeptidase regulatory-like domain-containing protein [Acidobacteria bacterium]|nr:carboxypeptidase regulatory-like domain-containing protein [Acidobacteriota bacterium]MBV9067665.1 carboxypeptidase regulatory-like domain-containing protein [Acidobacteriota bacterium]MBV9185911.1 carboxypeptidase regulatory-like domain-containing protein [Acidobacteriota bacterium]